jgi:hypothetical protein
MTHQRRWLRDFGASQHVERSAIPAYVRRTVRSSRSLAFHVPKEVENIRVELLRVL